MNGKKRKKEQNPRSRDRYIARVQGNKLSSCSEVWSPPALCPVHTSFRTPRQKMRFVRTKISIYNFPSKNRFFFYLAPYGLAARVSRFLLRGPRDVLHDGAHALCSARIKFVRSRSLACSLWRQQSNPSLRCPFFFSKRVRNWASWYTFIMKE